MVELVRLKLELCLKSWWATGARALIFNFLRLVVENALFCQPSYVFRVTRRAPERNGVVLTRRASCVRVDNTRSANVIFDRTRVSSWVLRVLLVADSEQITLRTQDLILRSLNATKEELQREQKARKDLQTQSEIPFCVVRGKCEARGHDFKRRFGVALQCVQCNDLLGWV